MQGILARTLRAPERRATFRNPVEEWLVDALTGGRRTLSGETISPSSAMSLSAYYAVIRAISEDCGKLPLKPYERLKPRGKRELVGTSLYRLIHDEANPEMSAQAFRETLTSHAIGWGGGYAEIVRNPPGAPLAMFPLRPDRVRLERDKQSRALRYIITDDTRTQVALAPSNVFHLHGLGFDGLTGYSMAEIAKQSLGLAKAQETSASALFGNLGRPGTVLKTDATMSDEAKRKLAAQWTKAFGGSAANWFGTAILEGGMTHDTLSPINPKDAEWILERQFSIEEVCRWGRVPPHKVAHLLRATFDNIAEQNIEYVIDTLLSWLKRWEAEIWRKLVPIPDQGRVFAEHTVEGLLRGNFEQQAAMFTAGKQGGWYSTNDIRGKLNENPIGPEGDIYYEPLNMQPAGTESEPPEPERAPEPIEAESETSGRMLTCAFDPAPYIDAHLPAMTDAYGRVLRVEADKAERAERRKELEKWAGKFYASHGEQVRGALIGPIEAFCGSLWVAGTNDPMPDAVSRAVASCTAEIVERHIAESRAAMGDGPIVDVLKRWRNGRAEATARTELRSLADLLLPLIEKR
jgi:HK97 family phage portal protein